MANPILAKQFQKALGLWPKDVLRPHAQFQDAMRKRALAKPPTEAETNSLFSLLENRYTRKYGLQASTMRPTSNPDYYDHLVKEIHEAPKRSWFARYVNSWKGFLRWK